MKKFFFFLLFINLLFVLGCATMADVRYGQGAGSTKLFNVSFDTLWNTTRQALNSLELPIIAENKDEGYFLVDHGITFFSWGEKVAVFVTKINDRQSRVEVISKRLIAINITAPNWEPKIIRKIQEIVVVQ